MCIIWTNKELNIINMRGAATKIIEVTCLLWNMRFEVLTTVKMETMVIRLMPKFRRKLLLAS
jgi:hypothetical protein